MSVGLILRAENISRQTADGRWLLRQVSLSVHAGDRWAVTGPTGAGKTLLLRALSLLDEIDDGRILWNDSPISNDAVPRFRRSVIYLHQRPVLLEGNVETNLNLPFQFRQSGRSEFDRARIVDLLSKLGRDATFLEKASGDLSGGESQIVALLRAIQLEPAVLLLDEPTAALDALATAAVETLVETWLNESPGGRATVWVGHDTAQTERMADKLLRLEQGCLQE